MSKKTGSDSINMPDMVDHLKEKHQAFIKKYGVQADRKIADRALQRDQLYAKLVLVATAFKKAGIATTWEEVDVRSVREAFIRSVAIKTVAGTPVYMLNGCNHIIVTDGAVSEDPFSRVMVLLGSASHTSFMESYDKVLSEDFDWDKFSMDVLDAIHKIAYYSTEVVHKYFENSEENNNA